MTEIDESSQAEERERKAQIDGITREKSGWGDGGVTSQLTYLNNREDL